MRLMLFAAVVALYSLNLGCTRPERTASGVLFISIDTLRADHLSCYGYSRPTSPNLDAFAEDAALFENAYAQSSFTLTSHMSMLTSLFPASHWVEEGRKLSDGVPLVSEVLSDAGYHTIGFHNTDWLNPAYGFSRGFDLYERHRGGGETLKRAVTVLDGIAPDEPFFLFLHLMDVHSGPLDSQDAPLYNSPPAYRDRFLPHPEIDTARHLGRDIYEDRIRLSEKEHQNIIAQYDGGVLYADWIVGKLLKRMKALDLYAQTLIIVTSDHGESLGDHGTFGGHGLFWENGLRIPLLVKLPEAHPKRGPWRRRRLPYRVRSVDIAPTILETLGLAIPPSFQGQSLLVEEHRIVVAQRLHDDPRTFMGTNAFIDDRYKLITEGPFDWQLYDLVADPAETRPIQEKRRDVLGEMERAFRAVVSQLERKRELLVAGEGDAVSLSPEARQRLRALGYFEP